MSIFDFAEYDVDCCGRPGSVIPLSTCERPPEADWAGEAPRAAPVPPLMKEPYVVAASYEQDEHATVLVAQPQRYGDNGNQYWVDIDDGGYPQCFVVVGDMEFSGLATLLEECVGLLGKHTERAKYLHNCMVTLQVSPPIRGRWGLRMLDLEQSLYLAGTTYTNDHPSAARAIYRGEQDPKLPVIRLSEPAIRALTQALNSTLLAPLMIWDGQRDWAVPELELRTSTYATDLAAIQARSAATDHALADTSSRVRRYALQRLIEFKAVIAGEVEQRQRRFAPRISRYGPVDTTPPRGPGICMTCGGEVPLRFEGERAWKKQCITCYCALPRTGGGAHKPAESP